MKSPREAGYIEEPLVFEKRKDRSGFSLPPAEMEERAAQDLLPSDLLRQTISEIPELSELEVIRHFTQMSQWNHSIDTAFYPLGSCTMNYNPKINERTAAFPAVTFTHPEQPESAIHGNLELLH